MIKSYRRYSLYLLGLFLIQSVFFSGFNLQIDPYGIFQTPAIMGINRIKPEKRKQVRLFKAIAVSRIKPQMVFLGSSRTEFGLSTSHPVLQPFQPAYNLALPSPNMYEVRRYLEHAIANNQLKQVVLGIDFFMFNFFLPNTPDFNENRLEKTEITLQDTINSIYSIDVLLASVVTVRHNQQKPNGLDYFHPDGSRTENRDIIFGNQPMRDIMRAGLQQNTFLAKQNPSRRYQLSQDHLNELQTIVNLCREHQINLKIFISPAHGTHWESIRVGGFWPVFEQWKREIVKIYPIWDFSGYNSITTEPISDDMKNYLDSSHYTQEIGKLLLNRIFQTNEEKVPRDFGILITPENVESHIQKIQQDRAVWAEKNPEVVEFVEKLKPE
jgi:hypothetical protein